MRIFVRRPLSGPGSTDRSAVGGVEQKAHFLCMDLPQSYDCFVIAFPAENTEAFLEALEEDLVNPASLRGISKQ
jgi:hypothetical protein